MPSSGARAVPSSRSPFRGLAQLLLWEDALPKRVWGELSAIPGHALHKPVNTEHPWSASLGSVRIKIRKQTLSERKLFLTAAADAV